MDSRASTSTILRRRLAAAAVLASLQLAALPAVHAAGMTPQEIQGAKPVNATEAFALYQEGVPFVDTRLEKQYRMKTVKGAINVPYGEKSEKEPDFDAKLDKFDLKKLPGDKSTRMVLFCNAGPCWRSYKAVTVAVRSGYTNIYWMRTGFPAWYAHGLPVQ